MTETTQGGVTYGGDESTLYRPVLDPVGIEFHLLHLASDIPFLEISRPEEIDHVKPVRYAGRSPLVGQDREFEPKRRLGGLAPPFLLVVPTMK